jgi:hypothetical protein
MPEFAVGKEVVSAAPMVSVDNPLRPGSYRFQLVVIDDSGNASAPAFVSVSVQQPSPPPPPPSTGVKFNPQILATTPIRLNPNIPIKNIREK